MSDPIETGLALSGGGYRAMLFNLGGVWRLNECGWLRRLDMITSVSGGSILNGVLATRWRRLNWDSRGVAGNFVEEIVEPVRALAGVALDVAAGVEGLLSIFSSISDKIAEAYDEHLFHGARLQRDVPAFDKGRTPRFLFYATSLQTGSGVRIERKRLADYRIGEVPDPDLPVARVVAASSAFPPVLSPVQMTFDPAAWRHMEGAALFERDAFKRTLLLTDGGVYDNMGLEAIWDRCKTVFVSDAGAPLELDPEPPTDWTRQAVRVLDIVTEQTRALRRRELVRTFENHRLAPAADGSAAGPKGAYWGIRTRIASYGVDDAIAKDTDVTQALQHIRTRLNVFTPAEQGRLINWGYALADAALRRYIDSSQAAPVRLPAPDYPLDTA